jgi:hypothetical protein
VCFLLPLAAYAYLGIYNRWISDDYCEAAYFKTGGVLVGSIILYLGWTGRFFASVLGIFLTSLDPGAARWVPGTTLAVWLVVLAFTLYQLFFRLQRPAHFWVSTLLAVVILSTTIQVSPKVDQPLFWEQAMVITVPSLALAALYAGLVLLHHRRSELPSNLWRNILFFSIAFIAGGCSETYITAATSMFLILVLGLIAVGSTHDIRKMMPWSLTGFIGSFFALILNLAAPGNIGHANLYAPTPGPVKLLGITLSSFLTLITKIVTNPIGLLGIISLLGIILLAGAGLLFNVQPAATSKRTTRMILIWLPAVTVVLLLASLVPAAYGQSTPPPDRTLIIPYHLLVCGLAVWGYYAGQAIQPILRRISARENHSLQAGLVGLLLVIFSMNSLWAAYQVIQIRPSISRFAAEWDRASHMIFEARDNGMTQVTVPSFKNWAGIEDIGPDPTFWVNRCATIYYGIEVITQ